MIFQFSIFKFQIEHHYGKSFGADGMEQLGKPERVARCVLDAAGLDAFDGAGRLRERAVVAGRNSRNQQPVSQKQQPQGNGQIR